MKRLLIAMRWMKLKLSKPVQSTNYMKKGTNLYVTSKDILANSYGPQSVGDIPAVNAATKVVLSDVVNDIGHRIY